MGWRLSEPGDAMSFAHVKRFDARFWAVNFPRPMMASVVTTGPRSLRVDAVFYREDDLAGLIWEAEDVHDHPLLAYETNRDFRRCQLRFRWRSSGVLPLDAINGPTLTIEGRDAVGNPRAWYVRLWNYAEGDPDDAEIAIDFGDVDGGFALPADADPVWAGDVDRMFLSMVPPGFGGSDPLPAPVEAWVEIEDIASTGSGSVLRIGDAMLPEHGLRIASGYDDSYHVTPARLLRNMVHLGYRALINHYVGMSHYFRLAWDAGAGAFLVSLADGALNAPCIAWHRDFAERAKALGYGLILSLSYELFDEHCRDAWKQRAEDGAPALTGWVPPSTLLSPAQDDAMAYLQAVARAFVAIAVDAGQAPRFQIGEPWWWIMPDGRPCLYDSAAVAAFGGAPVSIADVRGTLDAGQKALLDAAGVVLADSTAALRDAVRDEAAGCEVALLVYLPTVLDPAAAEVLRANVPLGWASPAYDVLQLEDYDWVTGGHARRMAQGIAAATARLAYPIEEQHYFSGFVLDASHRGEWARIDAAAEAGRARGTAETLKCEPPSITGESHGALPQRPSAAFREASCPAAAAQRRTFTHSSVMVHVMSVPTDEEFERARQRMAMRDINWDEMAALSLQNLGEIAVLHHFALFPRGVCSFAAVLFLHTDKALKDAKAQGLETAARHCIQAAVDKFRADDCAEYDIQIEMDSYENVKRNFGGSYFNRLR